jgi:hypothetical protein
MKAKMNTMQNGLMYEACLGFSGPEDQVVSLNVPLAAGDRHNSPFHAFDVEYDPEQPDKLVIRLLELDQDGFIRTALQSVPLPVDLLADLVSKRKATAEEVAEWTSWPD